jgi:hypothetical protein
MRSYSRCPSSLRERIEYTVGLHGFAYLHTYVFFFFSSSVLPRSELDFDCRELFCLLHDLLVKMVDPIRPTEVTSSSLVVLISFLFLSFAGDAAILAVMLGKETVVGSRIDRLHMLTLLGLCAFCPSFDQSFDVVFVDSMVEHSSISKCSAFWRNGKFAAVSSDVVSCGDPF